MGSPSNEPGRDNDETQHRVRISRDFWMGQTEVTQGLWKAVMGSNPTEPLISFPGKSMDEIFFDNVTCIM